MASSRAKRVIIKPRRFEDGGLSGNKISGTMAIKSEPASPESETILPISVNLSNAYSEKELSIKTEAEEFAAVEIKPVIKMEVDTVDPIYTGTESALDSQDIATETNKKTANLSNQNQSSSLDNEENAAKQDHIYFAPSPKEEKDIKYSYNHKDVKDNGNIEQEDDPEYGIDVDLLVGDVISQHVQWIQNKKGSRLTNNVFLTNLFPDRDSWATAIDQSELLNKIEEARTIQLKFYKNPKALEYFEQEPFANFLDSNHTFYKDIKSMEKGLRMSGTSLQNRIRFPQKRLRQVDKIRMKKSPEAAFTSQSQSMTSQPEPIISQSMTIPSTQLQKNHDTNVKPNILGKRKNSSPDGIYEDGEQKYSIPQNLGNPSSGKTGDPVYGTEEHYKALLEIKDQEIARLWEMEKNWSNKYATLQQKFQNLQKEDLKKAKFNSNLWKLNNTLENKLELQNSQITTLTECVKSVGDFTKSSDSIENYETPEKFNDDNENNSERPHFPIAGPSKHTMKPRILSRFVADTTVNVNQDQQNGAGNEGKKTTVGEDEDVQIITSTNNSNMNPEKKNVTVFLDQRNDEVTL